eukprot:9703890-Alexandrium_andersonii.AAC.1
MVARCGPASPSLPGLSVLQKSTPDLAGFGSPVSHGGCPRLLRPRAGERAGALPSIARLTRPRDHS